MAVSEQQLQTWSHQGSKAQSAATYEAIRNALNDPKAPYQNRGFEVFLQGSYGNDTNIYADSDVDVVICLNSIFYTETSRLNAQDKARYEASRSPASYTFAEFKTSVFQWLVQNFGEEVRMGKKAIFIPGSGTRRDADVLVCVEHRDYLNYNPYFPDYWQGICFWTPDGTKIINYPKQHSENCTSKHKGTSNRFKPNVRVLKNMRNTMSAEGLLADGVAPSYFLEGLLSNVPNTHFVYTYRETVDNYLSWIRNCDTTNLMCANDIHFLIRDGHSVCWSDANFQTFMTALRTFWKRP